MAKAEGTANTHSGAKPARLDDVAFTTELTRLTQQVAKRSGLDVQLRLDIRGRDLDPESQTAIYRIVEEGLTNSVKHAHASSVSIGVTSHPRRVHVMIEDDGVGFEVDKVRDGAVGLVGISERARSLGGRFEIETEPGAGTVLFAEFRAQGRSAPSYPPWPDAIRWPSATPAPFRCRPR